MPLLRRGTQSLLTVMLLSLGGDAVGQVSLLVGEWHKTERSDDTAIESLLLLNEGGGAHVEVDGVFSQAFLRGEDDEALEQLADRYPDGLRISIVADGNWTATLDSVTLIFPDVVLLINGDTFSVFLEDLARSLAADVIEQLNLPADQEPAVVATFVELLSQDLSETDVTERAFASNSEATAYRLEAGELIFIDADGTEGRWQSTTQSLVEILTWAQVKLDSRT